MIARLPSAPRATDVDSPVGKLAACDESLSLLASDMEELAEELGRLRAGAEPLMDRLAERDAQLTEKELALSRLERERTLALRRAEDASAALRDARDRLHEQDGRATTAAQELAGLRSVLAERERQLERAERELALMADAVVQRDAALVREQAKITDLESSMRSEPEPEPEPAPAAAQSLPTSTEPTGEPITGHVRFAPFPEGYRLVASEERCSLPGDLLEVEGRPFVVARVGRSPLPADARPCAFLEPRVAA